MRFAPRLLLWLLEQSVGWRYAASSGVQMDHDGLNEANWERLDGDAKLVISPSSLRATSASPYRAVTPDGETRFLGHEMTPGVYAIYRPRHRSEQVWLDGLELVQ
ncbi:MAG: hypothetical protein HKO13_06420 [Sphingomonas sp.]|nr:hypothetical protein [Sphingomonas sp.]